MAQNQNVSEAPIFVVGAPRSGTTLLAAILASHERLTCGPETTFFLKIPEEELRKCVADEAWPRLAVERIWDVHLTGQRVASLYGVSRDDLETYLSARQPSVGAMLGAIVDQRRLARGAQRWIEKTPNHLLSLDQILDAFPDAKIVHIVRDPRDVARSMRSLPWASSHVLGNAWLWRDWYRRSGSARSSHSASIFTVRYEDLVTDPEVVISAICDFIGEVFTESMLHPEHSADDVTTPAEEWKRGNRSSLSASRALAWRANPNEFDTAVSRLCASEIDELGYILESYREGTRLSVCCVNFRVIGAVGDDLSRKLLNEYSGVDEVSAGSTALVSMPPLAAYMSKGTLRLLAPAIRARLRRAVRRLPTRVLRENRTFRI